MSRRRTAGVLLALAAFYWAVVAGSVLYNVFLLPNGSEVGYGMLKRGCYLTDAMLVYVECHGFFGAQLVRWVLSLPWIIFQLKFFVFGSRSFLEILIFVPLAVLFWGPLVYPLFYRWHRGRETS